MCCSAGLPFVCAFIYDPLWHKDTGGGKILITVTVKTRVEEEKKTKKTNPCDS